jgi:hypothetical protein
VTENSPDSVACVASEVEAKGGSNRHSSLHPLFSRVGESPLRNIRVASGGRKETAVPPSQAGNLVVPVCSWLMALSLASRAGDRKSRRRLAVNEPSFRHV